MTRSASSGDSSSMSLGKPCMGLFLQGGVKALSVVEAGVEFAMMTVGTIAIIFVLPLKDLQKERETGSWRFYARLASWGYSYVYAITSIIVSQRLFTYASQRRTNGVLTCVTIAGILHALCILNFTLYTIFIRWFQAATMTAFLGFMLYKFYFFWVTICYVKEMRRSEVLNPALRQLSDEEIEQFFDGDKGPNLLQNSEYEGQRYKWDFEIPLSRLNFLNDDYNNFLGQGAYGIVHKAILSSPQNNQEDVVVAVKTVANNVDVTYFKALLTELKIMTCIGYHENIVNLIGACTSEIKNRQLYIIVELCHLGSMASYLQSNRELYYAQVLTDRLNCLTSTNSGSRNGYVTYGSMSMSSTVVGSSDFVKWSKQTASGMGFMARKKIIHGDLAARNILLTKDRRIKISDFGLSRQLYNYSAYVKKDDGPLPFRWMSPESLTDLHFSTQSDSWSFGVTIWEYFSCAELPYGGWNYCDDFVQRLKSGEIQLERPRFASLEIYEMMKNCWKFNPKERPTFEQLEYFFDQQEQKLTNCII